MADAGGEIVPSWVWIAYKSTPSQISRILPSSTRTIAVPVQLTGRPVAGRPNSGAARLRRQPPAPGGRERDRTCRGGA